jgi:hypothetical protein
VPARYWWRAAALVAARPRLWATGVRQTFRLARPSWWRHRPFLPLPDPEYLGFRFETQYGPSGSPRARDVVAYLEWCREMGSARPA